MSVGVGDRLVVLANPGQADKASGFVVAGVTQAEDVRAEGMYVPVLEMPYMVVDGIVAPL